MYEFSGWITSDEQFDITLTEQNKIMVTESIVNQNELPLTSRSIIYMKVSVITVIIHCIYY